MRFWNFIKNAETEDVELRISGEIVSDDDAWIYEWFGIPVASPNAFREALAEHKGKDITVWIDSPGGDVFAGVGIYNALMENKGKVTAKVEKAFSAASIIAMAGGDILMSPGALMLIHNPWTNAQGESKDMRHVADLLDEVKEAIMNVYELKTGRSRQEISDIMDKETPMSASTAIKEGFADGMLYTEAAESLKNYYTSNYRMAIQNSMNRSLEKVIEVKQKQQAQPPEETPTNNRVFDIKRVEVREKIQNRRKNAWTKSKSC